MKVENQYALRVESQKYPEVEVADMEEDKQQEVELQRQRITKGLY